MRKLLHPVIALLLACTGLQGEVVRRAPDFTWDSASRVSSLRDVRGQPVVLLITPSIRSGAFRKQCKVLGKIYRQYAARGTVFAVAVLQGEARVPSDIPFVLVRNPEALAAALETGDRFAIAIVGKDGNLDYISHKVAGAARVRDVIQNSYVVQRETRS